MSEGGCSCGALRYRVALPEGARAFQDFHDPAKVWPAESLARWKKNVAASRP